MKPITKRLALACAAGLALAGAAAAQSDAPTPAQQKELDAARADLDRAAKHFAELTRKYNAPGTAPMIMTYEKQMVRKPVLGVLLAPDPQAGVRIAGVTPASGAAEAGLKSGDRLVSLDGLAVAGADDEARLADARKKLAKLDTKTPVRVGYVRDGREATVSVRPHVADRLFVLDDSGEPAVFSGNVTIQERADGEFSGATADRVDVNLPPGVTPEIHREVIRLGDGDAPMALDETRNVMFVRDCKDKKACAQPLLLMDAFRWNGLNLASLDPELGSYFGTDKGVLVLSAGAQLPGLHAGDVIRSIDGKPVTTPREAMDALRMHKAGDKASLALLRDHRDTSAQVTVPKAMPLPIPPVPPAPPAAPAPPPGIGAMPAPPAPPAAGKRRIVAIGKDGKALTWEGGPGDTPPAWVQDAGVAKTIERGKVYVDESGKTTVVETDGVSPPPAPPAPPSGDMPAPPAPPAPPPPPPPPED